MRCGDGDHRLELLSVAEDENSKAVTIRVNGIIECFQTQKEVATSLFNEFETEAPEGSLAVFNELAGKLVFLEDPSEVTEGSHVASVEFGKMTNKFLAPVGGKFSWAKGIKQGRELPSNVLIGSVRKPFSTWASKNHSSYICFYKF